MAEKTKSATTTPKPRKTAAKKKAADTPSNVTEITVTREQMTVTREDLGGRDRAAGSPAVERAWTPARTGRRGLVPGRTASARKGQLVSVKARLRSCLTIEIQLWAGPATCGRRFFPVTPDFDVGAAWCPDFCGDLLPGHIKKFLFRTLVAFSALRPCRFRVRSADAPVFILRAYR